MKWSDIANLVGKAAPVIGTVLGGPVGGMAGGLVASALGVEKDPEQVANALRTDPEAYAKLQALENEHREQMTKLALQGEEVRLADIASARERDVAVQRARGSNWRGDVLALLAIGGLVALIATLLMIQIPDGPARDMLLLLSGALVAITKDVYQFEFGSSRGSKAKDDVLAGFEPKG